jgi:hypothetical protein
MNNRPPMLNASARPKAIACSFNLKTRFGAFGNARSTSHDPLAICKTQTSLDCMFVSLPAFGRFSERNRGCLAYGINPQTSSAMKPKATIVIATCAEYDATPIWDDDAKLRRNKCMNSLPIGAGTLGRKSPARSTSHPARSGGARISLVGSRVQGKSSAIEENSSERFPNA